MVRARLLVRKEKQSGRMEEMKIMSKVSIHKSMLDICYEMKILWSKIIQILIIDLVLILIY